MDKILSTAAIIVAIVAIMISCVAVGLNREEGPKGDTGLTGPTGPKGATGAIGATGEPGINGLDAPINQPPTIKLVNMGGNYAGIVPIICNYCKYTYTITVAVDDPEDETMRTTFYYCEGTSSGPWHEVAVFFGKDGQYTATHTFQYSSPQGIKKIYWLVEAWDGSDITTEIFPQEISP